MVKIAGSFLKVQSDFDKIKALDSVCDYIHYDVMDGRFTERPTLPINKMKEDLSKLKKPLDVHLMAVDNMKYIDEVIDLKLSYITFHLESTDKVSEIIDYIHGLYLEVTMVQTVRLL